MRSQRPRGSDQVSFTARADRQTRITLTQITITPTQHRTTPNAMVALSSPCDFALLGAAALSTTTRRVRTATVTMRPILRLRVKPIWTNAGHASVITATAKAMAKKRPVPLSDPESVVVTPSVELVAIHHGKNAETTTSPEPMSASQEVAVSAKCCVLNCSLKDLGL